MNDFLRATVAAVAITITGVVSSVPLPVLGIILQQEQPQAQTAADPQGPMGGSDKVETAILQLIVREGGAFAVILVILFFYRRDWKAATEYWKEQNTLTAGLVAKSVMSQTSMEAALRENTTVVHQAKHVMAKYLPQQRSDDSGHPG